MKVQDSSGASIKTRIETVNPFTTGASSYIIQAAHPLKQGLKHAQKNKVNRSQEEFKRRIH